MSVIILHFFMCPIARSTIILEDEILRDRHTSSCGSCFIPFVKLGVISCTSFAKNSSCRRNPLSARTWSPLTRRSSNPVNGIRIQVLKYDLFMNAPTNVQFAAYMRSTLCLYNVHIRVYVYRICKACPSTDIYCFLFRSIQCCAHHSLGQFVYPKFFHHRLVKQSTLPRED